MKRIRAGVASVLLVASVFSSGLASAGKDRPEIPEPGDGQFCVELGVDDLLQTVCIPMPS